MKVESTLEVLRESNPFRQSAALACYQSAIFFIEFTVILVNTVCNEYVNAVPVLVDNSPTRPFASKILMGSIFGIVFHTDYTYYIFPVF